MSNIPELIEIVACIPLREVNHCTLLGRYVDIKVVTRWRCKKTQTSLYLLNKAFFEKISFSKPVHNTVIMMSAQYFTVTSDFMFIKSYTCFVDLKQIQKRVSFLSQRKEISQMAERTSSPNFNGRRATWAMCPPEILGSW